MANTPEEIPFDIHLRELHASPDPARWLKDKTRAHTRQRSMEAAVYIFQTQGWQGISTANIARHVGVSQPGLYAHFDGIDDILARTVDALTRPLGPVTKAITLHLASIEHPERAESITQYAQMLVDWVSKARHFFELLPHRQHMTQLGLRMQDFERLLQAGARNFGLNLLEQAGMDPDMFEAQAVLYGDVHASLVLTLIDQHLKGAFSAKMCVKLITSQLLALGAHLFHNKMVQL